MKTVMQSIARSCSFALWSMRRRLGQAIPVGLAFLLLVGAIQLIGSLHDVSSSLTRQQIARSWHTSFDLFVRPQSAVSQAERTTGWIDPQSVLNSYGGISDTQITAIRTLPHVAQVFPFATVGWQGMRIIVPISLTQSGIYRISAHWNGQQLATNIVYYVDVSDISHLLSEPTITSPVVQHLLMSNSSSPVVFNMPVPVIQSLIGVPVNQNSSLQSTILQNPLPSSSVHLSLSLEKLNSTLPMLPACVNNSACWQTQQVQSGPTHYQSDGVQLLRYSQTHYSATTRQIASGQVSLDILGSDEQGPLYRTLLPEHLTLPDNVSTIVSQTTSSLDSFLPLTAPEHMPLVPASARFIPLAQACLINGPNCYSGLYLRLDGASTYSQQSLSLLQATSAAITARTGLHVDILDGSSTRTVSILLPSHGPITTIPSTWRVVGVAVQIVHGVDALQETLLVLCSFLCLLAIGASAVLIGIGRKKDMILLHQVGWSRSPTIFVLLVDALLLCLPGFLLSVIWLIAATMLFPSTLPPILLWSLLIAGTTIYCLILTTTASAFGRGRFIASAVPTPSSSPTPKPALATHPGKANTLPILIKLRAARHSKAFHTRIIAPFVCAISVTCSVFLIAIEYLLVTNFNQVLVVTILGNQVRNALEGPQLALLLVVIGAALLTIALCTSLLLRGRRFEFSILAMVGWERKYVLLRMLWTSWWPALISGEIGALLALCAIAILATLPSAWAIIGVVLGGPLVGVVLVSMVTIALAWQETERVFTWKT